MNDKELADKVVALELDGLHGRYAHKAGNREWFTYARDMEAKEFVRDWRVAGVLMEKLTWQQVCTLLKPRQTTDDIVEPRAIIEGCVEALP